ncbi:MAG: DUF1559 domain-containing protein [Planctomycetota bacterium]
MPHLYTCPECDAQTMVDDKYSGLEGKCFQCGAVIRIPHFLSHAARAQLVATADGDASSRRGASWLHARNIQVSVLSAVGVIAVLGVMVAAFRFGGAAVANVQTASLRAQCRANIKKIATALNEYEADNGVYPPAVIFDKNGKPMHSWRVLILPYLGHKDLFDQYNFNVPWDQQTVTMPGGWGGSTTLDYQRPDVYRSPTSSGFSECSYFVITGPRTVFPGKKELGRKDLTDEESKTILVAEGMRSTLWYQPSDYDISMMKGELGTMSEKEIGGNHPDGVVVATVDGESHFLRGSTDPTRVLALMTATNGGEPLSDDVLD